MFYYFWSWKLSYRILGYFFTSTKDFIPDHTIHNIFMLILNILFAREKHKTSAKNLKYCQNVKHFLHNLISNQKFQNFLTSFAPILLKVNVF